MASLLTKQGKWVYFNDRHLPLLSPHTWESHKHRQTFYAFTMVSGTRRRLLMHRLILGMNPGDPQVDHIDHDGLNNRDRNLRLATNRQNQSNLLNKPLMTSQYVGVSWWKLHQKWRANIQIDGQRIQLGSFDNEEDARDAYLAALAKIQ